MGVHQPSGETHQDGALSRRWVELASPGPGVRPRVALVLPRAGLNVVSHQLCGLLGIGLIDELNGANVDHIVDAGP